MPTPWPKPAPRTTLIVAAPAVAAGTSRAMSVNVSASRRSMGEADASRKVSAVPENQPMPQGSGGSGRGEQPPAAWDAPQLVLAALLELNPGSHHQVLHGARDEHFARSGPIHHARPDVHSQPAHVLTDDLHLTRVQATPDLHAQVSYAGSDRMGRPNGPGRAIERGQHAIARRLHVSAPMAVDLAFHEQVVALEK